MVDVVMNEVQSEDLVRPKVGGSRIGREYLFRGKEVYHQSLYQD